MTNLSGLASLEYIADALQHWVTLIESIKDDIVEAECSYLYSNRSRAETRGDLIKGDLIETLNFIIDQLNSAQRLGHTITIVGI